MQSVSGKSAASEQTIRNESGGDSRHQEYYMSQLKAYFDRNLYISTLCKLYNDIWSWYKEKLVNKYVLYLKNQLISPPFFSKLELTEADVPSFTLTSDQRKSEQLRPPTKKDAVEEQISHYKVSAHDFLYVNNLM